MVIEKKKKVLIDIDGCIVDMHRYLMDNIPKFFIKNNIKYKIDGVGSSEQYLGIENDKLFWDNCYFDYIMNVNTMGYVSEITKVLNKIFDVHIVTARCNDDNNELDSRAEIIKKMTEEYLVSHNIEYNKLEFVDSIKKLDYVNLYRIDYVIEDNVNTLNSIKKLSKAKTICYDNIYNQDVACDFRAHGWYEILKYLLDDSNGR